MMVIADVSMVSGVGKAIIWMLTVQWIRVKGYGRAAENAGQDPDTWCKGT